MLRYMERIHTGRLFTDRESTGSNLTTKLANLHVAQCYNCKEFSVWVFDNLIYPRHSLDLTPNGDLPEHIKDLYNEGRAIIQDSPKGAAALLRLALQHLCIHLGYPGRNINSDIASMVQQGLNPMVQRALDYVRIVGNDAVHPGNIDLNDNREIAEHLFELINLIAEQMISHPKKVAELYESLPEEKRDGVSNRDNHGPQS
ncbi:DUF4145 domain-containing protein [Arhodomonas sp. SL1]|uniref:DUF4145 domain-containing protein n=1 Tax=Arhodomonas sp. SL1 TaxID=3425691 RepID=UPI003F881127